ncbi:MAG: NAD(P)-dependent oxidoreductase [Clostridiales bacterium]|nr:NAD(P)-dependent oxidoreductase [Clostridiales bacterium]
MAINVIDEAKRCLNCKKPLCRTGCPINTPIPQMISMFLNGEITDAGEMVFENNPLSLVCSLICNHESQCQGHCILNRKGAPIDIGSIEHYISDNYFTKTRLVAKEKNGIKAAVIGSGPAGLTIAILLAERGYDITVFESKDKIGGVLRYGIPEFRLPKSILDRYQTQLKSLGIKIRPNTAIGKTIVFDDLFRDGYKAISIGTGVWWPNTLHIKGETLGNVHYAIHYLVNPDVYDLGETVNIIGAGNAAMDVARTVIRQGSRNVTIFSRTETYAASRVEAEMARIDGVKFVYNKSAVEITDEGVIFQNVVCDENENVVEYLGNNTLYKADSTIISVSQGPSSLIPNKTEGLQTNKRGLVVVNPEGVTDIPGVFASGDVVRGAKTVVEAVANSKKVADAMDEYLQKEYLSKKQE